MRQISDIRRCGGVGEWRKSGVREGDSDDSAVGRADR